MREAEQPTEPLQHPMYTMQPVQRDRALPEPGAMRSAAIPGSSVLRRQFPSPGLPSLTQPSQLTWIVLGPRHPQSSSWCPGHSPTDPLSACVPHSQQPGGLPRWLSGKEAACQRRKHGRCEFSLWLGRSPGGGNGNPLQCSCLDNPMDRGAWRLQSTGSHTTEQCLSTRANSQDASAGVA